MKKPASKIIVVTLLVSVLAAAMFCCCSAKLIQSISSSKACTHCPQTQGHVPDAQCLSKLPFADLVKSSPFDQSSKPSGLFLFYLLALLSIVLAPRASFAYTYGSPRRVRSKIYILSRNLRL